MIGILTVYGSPLNIIVLVLDKTDNKNDKPNDKSHTYNIEFIIYYILEQIFIAHTYNNIACIQLYLLTDFQFSVTIQLKKLTVIDRFETINIILTIK